MPNDFLTEPRPEKYEKYSPDPNRKMPFLQVGLAKITHSHTGLKIVPQVLPTFAMGIDSSGHGLTEKFDLPVSWARDLAKKMLEWCDLADQMNKNPQPGED